VSTGSEEWELLDINADGFPDLVVTGEMNAFGHGVFGLNYNPYWKVFFNLGNGFDSLAFNWKIPYGGQITNGIQRGYFYTDGIAYKSNEWDLGSRSWALIDLNGDRRPDFVSTGIKSLQQQSPLEGPLEYSSTAGSIRNPFGGRHSRISQSGG
jgi:hypothetical protein